MSEMPLDEALAKARKGALEHADVPSVSRTLLAHILDLERQLAEARKGMTAVVELIDASTGVAGLHLNGDVAPWGDLRDGGRFEAWLAPIDAALAKQDGQRAE